MRKTVCLLHPKFIVQHLLVSSYIHTYNKDTPMSQKDKAYSSFRVPKAKNYGLI